MGVNPTHQFGGSILVIAGAALAWVSDARGEDAWDAACQAAETGEAINNENGDVHAAAASRNKRGHDKRSQRRDGELRTVGS